MLQTVVRQRHGGSRGKAARPSSGFSPATGHTWAGGHSGAQQLLERKSIPGQNMLFKDKLPSNRILPSTAPAPPCSLFRFWIYHWVNPLVKLEPSQTPLEVCTTHHFPGTSQSNQVTHHGHHTLLIQAHVSWLHCILCPNKLAPWGEQFMGCF